LGRVADADVGAALTGELQVEGRLAGAHRKGEYEFLAVDLHFAKGVVLLGFARGQGRRTEADALGGELEAVAVEVVAVGDLEADLDGFVVDGAGGGTKGLVGRAGAPAAWAPKAASRKATEKARRVGVVRIMAGSLGDAARRGPRMDLESRVQGMAV
jgi:hypothetical protein